jgi:hypothetical protein
VDAARLVVRVGDLGQGLFEGLQHARPADVDRALQVARDHLPRAGVDQDVGDRRARRAHAL